jgi:5-methylcytosine-specific restriction protein B
MQESSTSFSWVPIHRETAAELLNYRERQSELLKLLGEMSKAGLKIVNICGDLNAAGGQRIDLTELDPFSFLANFNRGLTWKNRQDLWAWLKSRWKLESPVPDDFTGIPIVNNQGSWFIPYAFKRKPDDVTSLWQLFGEAVNKGPENLHAEIFNRCLQIHTVGIGKLTAGLFWINPEKFLSLDYPNRTYFRDQGIEFGKPESFADYLEIMRQVQEKLGSDFTKISRSAWLALHDDEIATATVDVEEEDVHYWTLSPGESGRLWDDFYKNGIAAIGWNDLGDLSAYDDRRTIQTKLQALDPDGGNQRNNSLACYEFSHVMKPGDIVFAKAGFSRLLGVGRVTGDYKYDPSQGEYWHTRKVDWFKRIEGKLPKDNRAASKTLTDVTGDPDFVAVLKKTAGWTSEAIEEPIEPPAAEVAPNYSVDDAVRELFLPKGDFEQMLQSLRERKNIVLQGPPGVGKSFMARRLAYALLGKADEKRVQMVQFHQSYSYEDFIQGYRPSEDGGFKLRDGIFADFCEQARLSAEQEHVFIIDEINRGNLSRIFGELLPLMEPDNPVQIVLSRCSIAGKIFTSQTTFISSA